MSDFESPTVAAVEMWVQVHQGPAAGQRFVVKTYPALIGRGQGCDIRLADHAERPTISRQHARLSLEGGRITLQDLSTNGTWVDSHQLSRDETVVLTGGEPVWFGSETLLSFQFKPSDTILAASHPNANRPDVRPTPIPMPPERDVTTLELARNSSAASLPLTLATLGRFQVTVNGTAIATAAWSSRKAVVLLVYLVEQAPRSVSLEKLVEALWSDDRGTRQALQTSASRLRQALRSEAPDLPDPLRFVHNQYALGDAYAVSYDVRIFEDACRDARRLRSEANPDGAEEKLTTALQTYQGSFLEGASEEWVERRRSALEQRYVEAAGALALIYERRGNAVGAVSLYRGLVERELGRESDHEGLIRSLAALGRRDEALRQYQISVGELKRLLDVGPGRTMIELREALVAGSAPPPPPS